MTRYRQLLAALDQPEALLARWEDAFARSAMSMSGRGEARELRSLMESVVEELARALPPADSEVPDAALPAPGTSLTRELDKAVAFLGATQAGRGKNGFDLAAALLALREVACHAAPDEHAALHALFEWLLVLALDAFARASASVIAEKHAAHLEHKTPMVMVTPQLPALLLMGAPDRLVLDRIFSKLLLAVVRVGARAAIVDASGIDDPEAPVVLESLAGFVGHRKITGKLSLMAVGLDHGHERAWVKICGDARVALEHHELFAQAVERGLDLIGYQVHRRSAQ